MDTFTVTGTIDGTPATVIWEDGVFTHDPKGVCLDRVVHGDDIDLTPTGPTYRAALAPADAALVTAMSVFDKRDVILDSTGEDILTILLDEANAEVPDEDGISL